MAGRNWRPEEADRDNPKHYQQQVAVRSLQQEVDNSNPTQFQQQVAGMSWRQEEVDSSNRHTGAVRIQHRTVP